MKINMSVKYNVVKQYIISLGLNLGFYGFENEYIGLPSALLYRSANNIAAASCSMDGWFLSGALRELATAISRVHKTRIAEEACEVDVDCSPIAWHRNIHRAWRREQTAMKELAASLWNLLRNGYAHIKVVRTYKDARLVTSTILPTSSSEEKILKALWDSWGNKPTFIEVEITPIALYKAVIRGR